MQRSKIGGDSITSSVQANTDLPGKTGRGKQNSSTDSYGHRRAAYSKGRLACLARRRSIQCAARTPFALKNLRAFLATDFNVRHASVAFNQAMAWLYH